MAKPRVFISSTYYDLKYIRNDLERFVREQGYEPVMNEKSTITYGSEHKLEEYCYKEIELCDIVVGVIGGRYGSESEVSEGYSVSNIELKTAIDKGKQLYIFIEKSVLTEYKIYQINEENTAIKYASVDNSKIFNFIDEIYSLPNNNQVQPFESVTEITYHLREQWAGLFQSLLSENSRKKELKLIDEINRTSETLKSLVDYLKDENNKNTDAINNILLNTHPAFSELQKKIGIEHRVYFLNKSELDELLLAYGYIAINMNSNTSNYFWNRNNKEILEINSCLFNNEGEIKIIAPSDWKSDFIKLQEQWKNNSYVPPAPPPNHKVRYAKAYTENPLYVQPANKKQ